MGVPVISSDVGFVSDYTTIRYRDIDELKRIIMGLIIPRDAWETAAARLKMVCEQALAVKQPRDTETLANLHRQDSAAHSYVINLFHAVVPRPLKTWILKVAAAIRTWSQNLAAK
jgi:hypothetical protein